MLVDLAATRGEISHALKKMASRGRPRKVSVLAKLRHARAYILAEPNGVVAVTSHWNYPFQPSP